MRSDWAKAEAYVKSQLQRKHVREHNDNIVGN
jgi:hypothetical protein